MIRLAINGFGRTGRCTFRHAIKDPEIRVVAINGTSDSKTMAHLLKYDSTYGTFDLPIEVKEHSLIVGGKEVKVFTERDPEKLPWNDLSIDVVIESTGKFRDREGAEKHKRAGAKRVIIGAPAKGEDITIVLGVNEKNFDRGKHFIISNASCTTNCLAPIISVLHKEFGIEKGLMTTVHAYTSDQRILDGTHKDLRRARTAGVSMIPTTTGAAKALKLVMPEMDGKLNGSSLRVPTQTVSAVDVTLELSKHTSAQEVNEALNRASHGRLESILGFCDEPLVSSDFKGDERSAIVDGQSTMAIGNVVKVLAWYDNEWAYAKRLTELAKFVGG